MSSPSHESTFYFSETNHGLVQNLGRPRTAIEIGASVGQNGQVVRERGATVVGLESNAALVDRARDLLGEAHHVTDLDAPNALEILGERKFDLAILDKTLHALRDRNAFLRRIKERLTDGGHIVACVASHGESAPGDGSTEAWTEELEAAGLQVMRVDVNPWMTRAVALKLGWYDGRYHEADLKTTHTMSGRFAYAHIVRPVERLIALEAPEMLAADYIIVARIKPKPGKLSLTVGMLTLNEKESVERMIDDIKAAAPDARIVLVDSSSDETPELAKKKGARVLRQLPPRGHGPAMQLLMDEAARETEALIYLDCDFTYPTHEIGRLRAMLESGLDMVNASRTARYPDAMPLPNFLANRFFAVATHVAHGVPTTDVHSGMRAYRSSMVRAFAFDGQGDALPLDTLILPARSNYDVLEFSIEYNERVGVSKLAKLRGTVWTFIRIARAAGHGKRVRRGLHYKVEK
jgi:SAM-dependent methyltransferase